MMRLVVPFASKPSALLWLRALALIVTLMSSPAVRAMGFAVANGRILKDGTPFVVKGVNVDGPQWAWNHNPVPDTNLLVQTWGFNAIRVNTAMSAYTSNNFTMDQIVNAFTPLGCVVIIELHDCSGTYYTDPPQAGKPSLTQMSNWWAATALKYRDNPNVWFNIMNEPGSSTPVDSQWKTTHEAGIRAIRVGAGATNIIICDGNCWAAENQSGPTVPDSASAILTYGPGLTNYQNIAFAIHTYEGWNFPTSWNTWAEGSAAAKLGDLLDRIASRHLAVIIGEFGEPNEGGYENSPSIQGMYQATKARNVGRMVWHWTGWDGFHLTTLGGGEGWKINPASPTNGLSFLGEVVYYANHGWSHPEWDDPNCIKLSRETMTATASSFYNGQYGNRPPGNVIDPALDNEFDSGIAQNTGDAWLLVDLGYQRKFNKLVGSGLAWTFDYPRVYEIYSSDDTNIWGAAIAAGTNNNSVLRVAFPNQNHRFVKIVCKANASAKKWIWRDLNFYTTAGSNTASPFLLVPVARFGDGGFGSSTFDKASDGDTTTAFDASAASGAVTGIDAGTNCRVLLLKYWPRLYQGGRMVGGKFQGANSANGPWTDIYTIPAAPPDYQFAVAAIPNNTNLFRYYRYYGPTDGHCNIMEMQFYADPNSLTNNRPPFSLNAQPVNGGRALELNWPASEFGSLLLMQTKPDGLANSANWSTVAGSTQTNRMVPPIDPQNTAAFYGLLAL